MKWKKLMKSKKLFSLLLAGVVIFATIFVSYAIKHDISQSYQSIYAGTNRDEVAGEFDSLYPEILLGNGLTSGWLAGRSELVQKSNGANSGASSGSGSALAQLVHNNYFEFDYDDFQINENGVQLVQKSDDMNSKTSSSSHGGWTSTLLFDNYYSNYDRDFRINKMGNSVAQKSAHSPEMSSPAHDRSPSAAPEPATVILFGSGLLGLAALRKRLRR